MKDKLQADQRRSACYRSSRLRSTWTELNDVRVAFLGKKGELTAVLKSMKDVAPEERPAFGQLVNEDQS